MSKIRRVDFSPDEWIAGTRELTMEERGAYWDVCALMYSRGGPIPDDRKWLMTVLGVDRMRVIHRLIDGLIARGKLTVLEPDAMSNGFRRLTNARATAEIARSKHRIGGLRNQPQATTEPQPSHDGATTEPQPSHDGATTEPQPSQSDDSVSKENKDLGAPSDAVPRARALNHQPSTTNHKKITAAVTVVSGALAVGSPAPNGAGSRLAAGWKPEGDLRQWTIDRIASEGSTVSAGHELEKFQNYWSAQAGAKGRKADWSATWRNWILKAIEQEGQGNGSHRNGHSKRVSADTEDPIAAGIRTSLARRHLLPGG